MYTIIGGDGKEYGPVTADQVRSWIAAGRANLDTRAKFLGTDEWRRLADFPDFTGGEPPRLHEEPDPNLADRLLRLGAVLADSVIAMLLLLPGAMMIGLSALRRLVQGDYTVDASISGPGYAALGAAILVLVIVQTWLLSVRGQTLGKMLMRVRIVRFHDGSKAGFVHAVLLRAWVPALISFVPVVGVIFPFLDIAFIFGRDRRCLHDLIAGTKVVAA